MEEIRAQQEILDDFVDEGINITASPPPSIGLSQDDDHDFQPTQNATQDAPQKQAMQKANCANQIKWDSISGFLPNPKTFWRGLEYNYVYNEEDYDWLYDDEDEHDQAMDVEADVGTSPTRSANVSWYCICDLTQGQCQCNDKSRDDPNPDFNLNDTD